VKSTQAILRTAQERRWNVKVVEGRRTSVTKESVQEKSSSVTLYFCTCRRVTLNHEGWGRERGGGADIRGKLERLPRRKKSSGAGFIVQTTEGGVRGSPPRKGRWSTVTASRKKGRCLTQKGKRKPTAKYQDQRLDGSDCKRREKK